MQRFFRLFSFPGGIGSHCTPETPGSIHEGGELGYSLSHAFGAAFDNPDLIVDGDGRRRRSRNRATRHLVAFEQVPQSDPRRRGVADPASERLQDRQSDASSRAFPMRSSKRCSAAMATSRISSKATIPTAMHQQMAATLEQCIGEIRAIQQHARENGDTSAAALADDRAALAERLDRAEGSRRPQGGRLLARAPGAGARSGHQQQEPQAGRRLAAQLSGRRTLFDEAGRLVQELRELAPKADAAHQRQSACQRRHAAQDARPAAISRLCGGG